jgi:hypothetical protein
MARSRIRYLTPKRIIHWLLSCAILAVLAWLLFIFAGRALCYVAIRQIGELTNTKIKVESVDFRTDGSVYIRNLVIRPEQEEEQDPNLDDTIIDAKMVFARFSLGSLLKLHPRLEAIDVNDFVVNIQYDRDTQKWNIAAIEIKPPKGSPGQLPRVHLNAGTLQYTKISKGQAVVALSTPLNAHFEPDETSQKAYGFEIRTATMASGHGNSRLTGTWKPGSVTITGGISSIDVPDLEMAWIADIVAAELKYDRDNAFSLKLHVNDLQSRRSPSLEKLTLFGPALLESSGPFTALQKFFNRYKPRGQVDIELEASGSFDRLGESTLSGNVLCKDVEVCYTKFQYPIEHLAGRIGFTKDGVTLCNLVGWHGEARLLFNGWCRDFGSDQKYQIQIRSDNMPLDDDLYNALSPKRRELWDAFSPTGAAAIDYWCTRESPTDEREQLEVDLIDVGAVYRHFPYPLENLSGHLFFDDDRVTFSNVVSKANSHQVAINGYITTQDPNKAAYDVSVNVSGLPLDSTLEKALPQKQRTVYARYHPEGLADGWLRITTQDSGAPGFVADLSFKQATLKSDQFPLAVSDISAKAAFTSDLITIKEFSGWYGDGLLHLKGQIQPAQEQGQSLYRLAVKMEHISLNNDLLDVLPETLKKTVSDLKPEGKVNLSAQLSKENPTKYPDYDVDLECLGNSVIFPNLPYSLEDVTGYLALDANHVEIKDLEATLGNCLPSAESKATVRLNGKITLVDGALNDALLALSAHDVPFDDQFGLVLPARLRSSYDRLSATGLLDLDADNVHVVRTLDGQKSIDFTRGSVRLKSFDFNASGPRIQLSTTLQTDGLYKTGDGLVHCHATVDGGTVVIRGKSFTNLRADISFDPESRTWSSENLIADCYDGRLMGKLQIEEPTEQAGNCVLQAGFVDVDLQRFLSDTEPGQAAQSGYTSGRMNGSLCIDAKTGEKASRVGTCRLSISNMQVGKLSPLAKLLQVVRLVQPQDYAFDQMLVDAYVRDNGLLVRKLDLSGQDVAFTGSGWMDLQKNSVDLTLTARGRRLATDDPSVLQSLTEGLGRAVVQINVTGDIDDPKIKTETLPVLQGTLQVLGAKPATRN